MKKPDYKNWVPKSMVIGLGATGYRCLSVESVEAVRMAWFGWQ